MSDVSDVSDVEGKRRVANNWREYLQDSKESIQVFAWVWREMINHQSRRWAKIMLALTVVSLVFGLAAPWLMSGVIDGLTEHDWSQVSWSLAGLAGCWVISHIFEWLLSRFREMIFGENVVEIDCRITEMFLQKSLGQHLRDNSILSVGNLDKARQRISGVMETLLFDGLQSLVHWVLAFGLLFFLSPIAGLIALGLIINHLVWAIALNHHTVKSCAPIDLEFRRCNRHRHERWEKVERVKTAGQENYETHLLRSWMTRIILDDRNIWLGFINVCFLRGFIEVVGLLFMVGFGVWQVWEGFWTVGLLYPLFAWGRNFVERMWRIGHIERLLQWALPSIDSMRQALTIEPDVIDKPDAIVLQSDVTPNVSFRSVSHVYLKETINEEDDSPHNQTEWSEKQQILNSVEFDINPGEKVALIGPSGAGKTTVMRLIQRYFDPAGGAILVDGHDMRDIKLNSWQNLVGYVPQQPQVLDGTIRSNLLYGLSSEERDKISDDQLWSIVRKLRIDFGDRLTDGLDTKVGPKGIKLSGGEQQRLMIGAAAMKKPKFWIIDEATSSLDSSTEKAVQQGLSEVMEEGTSALVIAHRLSTVRHSCDKFVILTANGNGSRVEAIASSFEELYQKSATFRQLADDQELEIQSA